MARSLRDNIRSFVENGRFQIAITTLIVINGITMGFETSKSVMESYGGIILTLDAIILSIFVVEIVLRIYAHRLQFFKDPWSLFDLFVVAVSLIPASGNLSVLRVLRVLRLFRLVTVVPQMRKVIEALVAVIPGIASIAAILSLIFYVSAIMATNLFGSEFDEWFGTLWRSTYTLFQIMTLESWSMGIVRPVMDVYPYAWLFFMPYILFVTFIMINLLIAVIVDAMNHLKDEDLHKIEDGIGKVVCKDEMDRRDRERRDDDLRERMDRLSDEIREIKELLSQKR